VPTISFNGLACRTSVPEAPNGSIKRAEPEDDVPHFLEADFSTTPGIHFRGLGVLRQIDVSGLHERPGEASPNPF
jgi:hypothetical protein